MTKDKEWNLALEIWESPASQGYGHISARFVKYLNGHIDYFYDYSHDGVRDFSGLEITCQMDSHKDTGHTYGHEVGYTHHGHIKLNKAKRMVSTLQYIEKGLEKRDREFGYTTTFADYLIRIASIFKIKHFIFKKYDRPFELDYEAKHAKYTINRMVTEITNRLRGVNQNETEVVEYNTSHQLLI